MPIERAVLGECCSCPRIPVGSAGAALATSETIVGGIGFGAVAAGADLVSEGAGFVSVTANVFAGRWGNATLGAVGIGIGAGSGLIKAAPKVTQFLSKAGLTGLSHAAGSICP